MRPGGPLDVAPGAAGLSGRQSSSAAALTPLMRLAYQRLCGVVIRLPGGGVLARDHLLFFALATAGLFLITPFYIAHALRAAGVVWPALSALSLPPAQVPYTSPALAAFLIVFLTTFSLSWSARRAVLIVSSVPIGLTLGGHLDPLAVGLFAAFVPLAYWAVTLPRQVWMAIALSCGLSFGLLSLSLLWEPARNSAIAQFAGLQPVLIPMLWYACYAVRRPQTTWGLPSFVGYLYGRFFGCPAISPGDLSPTAKGQALLQMRLAGVSALYVAALANLGRWGISTWLEDVDGGQLHGLPLLVFSYLRYVHLYFNFVVVTNVFVGVARLFGFAVKDNFNYWLLAKTPNDHWRRWNMLAREWVVTFIFFPIMRGKRWLFAAIMAALFTSGALHLLPELVPGRFSPYTGAAVAFYWTMNGLAIYLTLKVAQMLPATLAKLGVGRRWGWDVAGVIATSAFYAVLVHLRTYSTSWSDATDYVRRLVAWSL